MSGQYRTGRGRGHPVHSPLGNVRPGTVRCPDAMRDLIEAGHIPYIANVFVFNLSEAMMRKRIGRIGREPTGEGWVFSGELSAGEDGAWLVFYHLNAKDQGYVNFKILSPVRVSGRANYWIGVAKDRLSGSDVVALKEKRPILYKRAVALMGRVYAKEMGQ